MIKKIIRRIGEMCDAAYRILKISLMLSGFLMAAAIGAYAASGGLTVYTYSAYSLAKELMSLPAAILLVGILLSVCVEDFVVRR